MTKFNVHASDIIAKDAIDNIKFVKKKKLNQNIIRIGDKVIITTPEIVIRIGYPMSIYDAIKEVEKLYCNDIMELLHKTIYKRTTLSLDYHNSKPYNKIISALAYEYLKSKQFGGKERKIFSEYRQDLFGTTTTVRKIFIRKTGIYFPPNGGYDYWTNEYDYEPGGLDKEKTHKILELGFCQNWPNYIQIEACNVEKIYEE